MKYKEIRKTRRYKKEKAADGSVLTRSSFEFLYVVIIVMFLFALIAGSFLRVVSFNKKLNDSGQNYSVVTIKSDDYKKGDIITYKSHGKLSAGEIVGEKGDVIRFGTDPFHSFNRIEYKNKLYHDPDELGSVLEDSAVPDGYVLINGDLTSSENQIVGELVCENDITGRAAYIVYPFSLFGRTADYLKR